MNVLRNKKALDSTSNLTTSLAGKKKGNWTAKKIFMHILHFNTSDGYSFFYKGQSTEKAEHLQLRITWQFGLIHTT